MINGLEVYVQDENIKNLESLIIYAEFYKRYEIIVNFELIIYKSKSQLSIIGYSKSYDYSIKKILTK